jgi:hypothetical protein
MLKAGSSPAFFLVAFLVAAFLLAAAFCGDD